MFFENWSELLQHFLQALENLFIFLVAAAGAVKVVHTLYRRFLVAAVGAVEVVHTLYRRLFSRKKQQILAGEKIEARVPFQIQQPDTVGNEPIEKEQNNSAVNKSNTG